MVTPKWTGIKNHTLPALTPGSANMLKAKQSMQYGHPGLQILCDFDDFEDGCLRLPVIVIINFLYAFYIDSVQNGLPQLSPVR